MARALVAHLLLSAVFVLSGAERSFIVDYEKNVFLKDGRPFRYISGSIHYARVLPQYWPDRLAKMRAAGLNAIQTYVPWNWHEEEQGVYNFEGAADVVEFVQQAQKADLLVLLRAGPYICGEWESGGFPGWMSRNRSMKFRSSDPTYLAHVTTWLNVLLPKMKPLLYANGGPIIAVQVENEYGSFGCDHDYIKYLETLFRKLLGNDVILYSTDGANDHMVTCGSIPELYSTVDFGPGGNPQSYFQVMRSKHGGPYVNSEFYTGWLDHWGHPHAHVSTDAIVKSLTTILGLNASVNMYMFEGGTNFGFWNGANTPYSPQPTSYDYNAPLTESGRYYTEKYDAIRKLITEVTGETPPSPPDVKPAQNYGQVPFTESVSLPDALAYLAPHPVTGKTPLSFEDMSQNYGFVLYSNSISFDEEAAGNVTLTVTGMLHDRTVVLLSNVQQGVLSRTDTTSSLILSKPSGQTFNVHLLVENQGRINYGGQLGDSKGFVGTAAVDHGKIGDTWTMHNLPLNGSSERLSGLPFSKTLSKFSVPTFYRGTFNVVMQADSFLRLDFFGKGQAFINGFNLGRYWPTAGPQKALYVPGVTLKVGLNELIIFELDQSPCGATADGADPCAAMLTDVPDVGTGNTRTVSIDYRQ